MYTRYGVNAYFRWWSPQGRVISPKAPTPQYTGRTHVHRRAAHWAAHRGRGKCRPAGATFVRRVGHGQAQQPIWYANARLGGPRANQFPGVYATTSFPFYTTSVWKIRLIRVGVVSAAESRSPTSAAVAAVVTILLIRRTVLMGIR